MSGHKSREHIEPNVHANRHKIRYICCGSILPLVQFGIFILLPYTRTKEIPICTKGKIEPQHIYKTNNPVLILRR